MPEIKDWSVTSANNNSPPPDGAPPNVTKFGQVDNIIREMMAVIARWEKDTNGLLELTNGGINNFSVTTNRTVSVLYNGFIIRGIASATNTGSATLAVNGIPAKNILDAAGNPLVAGELNTLSPVELSYRSSTDSFYITGGSQFSAVDFQPPIGSKMLFYNDVAPVGWVQVLTVGDRVPLVTSGAGGTTSGSWTISGLTHPHTHTASFEVDTGTAFNDIHDGATGGGDIAHDGHQHHVSASFTVGGLSTPNVTSSGAWRPLNIAMILCERTS